VSWKRVRGHKALVESFQHLVERDRLAHAYLFVGPAGVGKHLFAHELAKALLCDRASPDRIEACDVCASCRLVEAGNHPDLFLAAKPADSPSMPIDVMRELRDNLAVKPARGSRKIALIDDADHFHDPISNHAAANCFLKTLEEPAPGSILILVGTSTDRQLPTVLSRCQVVRFAPLDPALTADILREQGVEDESLLARVLALAPGSPGQAKELADPALWEFRRTLLHGVAALPCDSVDLAAKWLAFVEGAGKEPAALRGRASACMRLLLEFFDDALRLSLGAEPRSGDADDRQVLQALATRTTPERLMEALERTIDADRQIQRRVQLLLIVEALLDALSQKLG
jgi:DNA polymerase-3 subunit delta'